MKKTLTLIIITVLVATTCILPAFANSPSLTVDLRIEGKNGNLFYDEITTNNSANYNIINILMLADSQSESMTIEGLSMGYITAINSEKIGQTESGLDTYNIRVNGEYVPFANAASYPLKNGDEILVYYGEEFGDGVMFPIVDTAKIEEGYIKFMCEVPSEDGKSTTVKAISGATVTWYCDEVPFSYTTDGRGGIYIEKAALTSGSHRIALDLYREDGTPLVLRLAPDYTVNVPVGIGDSFAVYVCTAVAIASLGAIVIIALSIKRSRKR